MQNAHLKSTCIPSLIAVHLWKSIIPLLTSCKTSMLCPQCHGSHPGLQFISGKPSSRCRRLVKCWECVHISSTICCLTILGTLYSAAGVSKNAGICLFDSSQTTSVCSRDGAMAKSSQHLGAEMPPRVFELWNFFQRCFPHKCFLLTGWFHVL